MPRVFQMLCSQGRGILNVFSIKKPFSIGSVLNKGLSATPITCRVIRQFHKQYKKSPSKSVVRILFSANKRLVADNSINVHIIKGLQNALKNKKKKRKQGKRLNLLGEEESGPQLFSAAQVEAAGAFQLKKEKKEEEHRHEIEGRKSLAAFKKLEKERERIERVAAALVKINLSAKAAQIQAQKREQQKAAAAKSARSKLPIAPPGIKKPRKTAIEPNTQLRNAVALREEEVVRIATSRGRRIQPPARYMQ